MNPFPPGSMELAKKSMLQYVEEQTDTECSSGSDPSSSDVRKHEPLRATSAPATMKDPRCK
jgi:hypothetical protein